MRSMEVVDSERLKVSTSDDLVKENADLQELGISQGINVWGTSQQVLEEQALHELQIFTENCTEINDIEDGEIVENIDLNTSNNNISPKSTLLDIESYINSQTELKKRQDYKKSLSVSDRSKEAARKSGNHVNKVYKRHKNKKIKTIMSENNDEHSGSQKSLGAAPQIEVVNADSTCPTNSLHFHNINEGTLPPQIEGINTDATYCSDSVDVINRTEDNSGSEYVPSEDDQDSDYEPNNFESERIKTTLKKKTESRKLEFTEKVQDDGLESNYKSRLALYYKQLEEELSMKQDNNDEEEEEHVLLSGGLKVPTKLWNNLYGYQQDGVKWLWKIHQKSTGALLGDEMGLGKTVQIIAFLQSLEYSRIISCHGRFNGLGPSLVVCPATVIHQWVKHFHDWAPELRIAVLHQSGSYQGNKAKLIKEMYKSKGIIVTTYYGILKYKGNLLEYTWHYIILDEGHKIRNPTAKVTIAVKQFSTPHKIMLTGSPMQNNLTELWSLFDFTNPGMLGNLTTFQEHFATPILHGGFSNSTPMQEATALSVATTLKNVISPYLLRRSKKEVQDHISLPNKSEQVLFCSLTNEQKDLYKGYLMSEHVNMILGRGSKNWFSENHTRANVLVAITKLRKICNHPDIYSYEADQDYIKYNEENLEDRFGYYKKSGKMIVVSALLKIWKKQGHRVLLFTQGRSMINIFQDFLELQGYKYLKMDGTTTISSRQTIINKFNEDSSYDVFLLTTRVGGLGVNLTGANRVIIFDPDWNPATDTQARERAWRIGQEKNVTIYRLLSAGTIEEKMYQRQVWKQLLSNKVLLDPRTNKFFRTSDLHDLFSLQESPGANPETANIFHESRVRIQETIKRKNHEKKKKSKIKPTAESSSDFQFTEDKIQAMKNLAQQIAKSLSQKKEDKPIPKTSFQSELEEERQKKLLERAELKKLTPQELLQYNKEKIEQTEDDTINKIDGLETEASFSNALEYSETTSKLHHDLNSGKVKDPEVVINKVIDIRKNIAKVKDDNGHGDLIRRRDSDTGCVDGDSEVGSKRHKKKKKDRHKSIVDVSGTIDGEVVEGLVKTESKKSKKRKRDELEDVESQDDFVLGKLFAKTGVSGALQHESIIRSGSQVNNLKIHTDAKMRAEKSLEALRKSRLDNWRW